MPARKMTADERIEAEILAAHLICCRMRESDVIKKIREDYACSRHVAKGIVSKVRREQVESAQATREEMLRQTYATLDEATMLAFKRQDVRAVVHVERLRAELSGLIGSELHLVGPPAPEKENELKGRSELDLRCRAVMGKWFADLTATERGELQRFLLARGDKALADEVHSQMN
jgi:hypothetical protein